MSRFRKRPIVIDAEQYLGQNIEGICFGECRPQFVPHGPHVHTLEGVMVVAHGDWVITGTQGEKYPCKPDIFAEIYEPVND